MTNAKPTIETTKKYYESDANLAHYGEAVDKVGLWKSEQIMFEKYINKSDKVLDLGCGTGRTTINLHRLGYENIVGLDLSETFISFAKDYSAKHGLDINFMQGDGRNLPFEDNSFDAVFFSFNGLMCIPEQKNRDAVLVEVYRVLKPGGKFIFTAHSRDEKGNYAEFWAEQRQAWANGTQDTRLEKFGDRPFSRENSDGEENIVHVASQDELKEFIGRTDFKILEYAMRPDIAEEDEIVQDFSSNSTTFWVLEK
jgi:ubiquinone/menaquinone biosynthesis C-methylase UbiE